MRPPLFALALLLGACSVPEVPAFDEPAPPLPTAPAVPDPFESEADYRQQRSVALAALTDAAGTAASAPASCRVLPVGERPCGGPSEFVAYSTEAAEVPVLLGLAREVSALDARATAQFEYVSTCEVMEPPPVALRDGRCVID